LTGFVICQSLCAQYQEVRRGKVMANTPLEEFVDQRRQLFNFDWEFYMGPLDPPTVSTPLDDSNVSTPLPNTKGAEWEGPEESLLWRPLSLPHDFQFEQPWTESAGGARGFKPMCEGWYRKSFKADPSWRGKFVYLDFGGIVYLGDVYVNGEKVASTEYGYVGFEVNITPYLNWEGDNEVRVWASTGPANGSRWYTGGGIFRDVYLILKNPTHLARHGVFVTTPQVSHDKATIQVQAEVEGWKQRINPRVRTRILSPEGEVLGQSEVGFPTLTKIPVAELTLPAIEVNHPQLWSPDTPCLYTAQVVVEAEGMVVDSTAQHFGIRTIDFGPQYGFKLNGKKLFLQGISNHHDLGALGAAAFDRAIIREMLTLKQFGFNTIRCSHNPYSERFTQLADSLGLLIVDELTDKWSDTDYWGGRKPFMSLWPQFIQEWVKRDRNSPSVILWSLGNELQTRPEWYGYPTNDWGITTYRVMDQFLKRYDTTRPTTVAMHPSRAGAVREEKEFKTYMVPPELACETEVASFNYQWDAYPKYFEHKPDLILFQSEATTNQLLAPFYGMDHRRTVGLAYWGAIEYWGESNKWPKKGWNYSYFRHTLQPMPQAYLIKSAFLPDVPVVRIGVMEGGESIQWNDVKVGQKTYADHWNFPKGSKQQVVTFTNAREVELFVNGKSLGRKQNDTTDVFNRNIITWQDVPYGEGGSIEAVAYGEAGREVARQRIETAGPVARLRIVCETPDSWNADGMDLQYLYVQALDRKGRIVSDFSDKVRISVEGEGQLLAVDNGDHYTDELFFGIDEKSAMNGQLQAILRSTRQAGPVTITASSGKLKTSVRLKTLGN